LVSFGPYPEHTGVGKTTDTEILYKNSSFVQTEVDLNFRLLIYKQTSSITFAIKHVTY